MINYLILGILSILMSVYGFLSAYSNGQFEKGTYKKFGIFGVLSIITPLLLFIIGMLLIIYYINYK